jgi:hypothetical protein
MATPVEDTIPMPKRFDDLTADNLRSLCGMDMSEYDYLKAATRLLYPVDVLSTKSPLPVLTQWSANPSVGKELFHNLKSPPTIKNKNNINLESLSDHLEKILLRCQDLWILRWFLKKEYRTRQKRETKAKKQERLMPEIEAESSLNETEPTPGATTKKAYDPVKDITSS